MIDSYDEQVLSIFFYFYQYRHVDMLSINAYIGNGKHPARKKLVDRHVIILQYLRVPRDSYVVPGDR